MKGSRGEIVAGRYEVRDLVGSGGFGTVYSGRQINLNRDVAIKVLRQGPEGSAVSRERFRREAVLSSGFSHPNIVTYHDFLIDEDGDMILVMEFLQGVTLDRMLAADGRLDVGRAAGIIVGVAAGLAECHRAGIVHRDIKPANIFILDRDTARERAKIIDFGILWTMPDLAGDMPGLTRENAFIGTPEYVAPEVLIGAFPDGRTDQYALALVALRAMTGEMPFPVSKGPALLDRLAARPTALGSACIAGCPAVRGVLYKALSPDPGDRFGDMDEFGRAMAAAAGVLSGEGRFPAPMPGSFGFDSAVDDDTVLEVRDRGGAGPVNPRYSSGAAPVAGSAVSDGTRRPATPRLPDETAEGRKFRSVRTVAAVVSLVACAGIAAGVYAWNHSRPTVPDAAPVSGSLEGGHIAVSGAAAPAAKNDVPAVKDAAAMSGMLTAPSSGTNGATAHDVAPSPAAGTAAPVSTRNSGAATASAALSAPGTETGSATGSETGSATVPRRRPPPASAGRPVAKAPATSAPQIRADSSATGQQQAPEPSKPDGQPVPGAASGQPVDPPGFGYFNAQVEPFAYVWIGGRNYGHTPLASAIQLAAGTHDITFRNPELNVAVTRKVQIRPGETTIEIFSLVGP